MKKHIALAAVAWLAFAAGTAAAETRPTVVELFTSQGCYSCPPAEAFLGELAGRDDVVALEFHVDYWDDLNYLWHGKWKDVFSSPAWTERQRAYNVSLRGRGQVYTPQMVIDGRSEAVGSARDAVFSAIERAAAERDRGPELTLASSPGGGLTVAADGAAGETAAVWLVLYERENTTEVRRGENRGKTLVNHNVVTELRHIGELRGSATRIELEDLRLAENQGCAVLVQSARPGPVLAAASCPQETR